jgi:hypothetical protein
MIDHMEITSDQKRAIYDARPEPGQLVEVRRRQWVVSEVNSSVLDSSRLLGIGEVSANYSVEKASLPVSNTQHLVSMSSIDEDGLGDELEAIRHGTG